MGTTSSLPEEVLTTKVAKYSFAEKKDLFALRATSKSGLALAQRALSYGCVRGARNVYFSGESHVIGEWPPEMRASARQVEAMGRVLGAGCIFLHAYGISPERIAALDAFVRRTNGGLRTLDLYCTCVTAEALLRMCRASPKLTSLRGASSVAIPDSTVISISAACPDLHAVYFSRVGRTLSPAETWQRHFPGLRDIKLFGGGSPYLPTRIDVIRETALTCRHATSLEVDGCHITADVMSAFVGTPLGDSLTELGEVDNRTVLEPDAILAAARGFPEFCSLIIPWGSSMPGPGFYIDLSRTNARITRLHILDGTTTDACVAAACSHLRLYDLELQDLHLLTSHIVDGITRSRSAATLSSLTIAYSADKSESPLRAADVLRLVQGCPNLKGLGWSLSVRDRDRAGLDRVLCQGIVDLLTDRGAPPDHCDFDELDLEVDVAIDIVDDDYIFQIW